MITFSKLLYHVVGAQCTIRKQAALPTLESPVQPCLAPRPAAAGAAAEQALPQHRCEEAPATPLPLNAAHATSSFPVSPLQSPS